MKIFVSLFAVGLLSISSAILSPEEAKADVLAHVEPQIFSLLSRPGIARAGGGVKCYDKYLPLITAATENSKSDTEACIARAASRREDELNKVKTERENLDSQVHKVEQTLTACLNKTDDLEYLKCLKENSQNLQNALNEVGMTSSSLSDNLSLSYKNIDSAEDSCIKAVISKSKSVSDELLAALQNCLMNGLDDGSDGGSEGGSDGGANGGSDGGSENGSDNGSDGNSDAGADNGSEGGSDNGSDAGSEGGSDAGSDGSSDGSADNGSEGGSDSGSDAGSEGGSDAGSDAGSEGGSEGGSDGSSDGSADNGSEGGSDSGSDAGSETGSDDASDSGVAPNPDTLPEEDLTP